MLAGLKESAENKCTRVQNMVEDVIKKIEVRQSDKIGVGSGRGDRKRHKREGYTED
jgi:hypothetical protein